MDLMDRAVFLFALRTGLIFASFAFVLCMNTAIDSFAMRTGDVIASAIRSFHMFQVLTVVFSAMITSLRNASAIRMSVMLTVGCVTVITSLYETSAVSGRIVGFVLTVFRFAVITSQIFASAVMIRSRIGLSAMRTGR